MQQAQIKQGESKPADLKQAHIIGLGRSGAAAARALQQRSWQVEIGDRATATRLHELRDRLQAEGITVKLGYSLDLGQDPQPDLIIVSPGVPWDIPLLQQAREQGIPTIGEMELAWQQLQPIPWVGITGTNGKTTTTALVGAMFQAAGLHAPTCGNIGYAACELAATTPATAAQYDWIIAEISSYQIESSSTLGPQIGIWTTLTPDHLARHHTLDQYAAIKASLLQRSQQQILNGDDPYLRAHAAAWPDAFWTSTQGADGLPNGRGFYIEQGQIMIANRAIAPVATLQMPGTHNQQNLLLAVGAAHLAGIGSEAITTALETFPGVPHRLETICTHQGVTFINDSKATNYDAAQVGLTAMTQPAVLIAGGEPKQGDDGAWLMAIQQQAAHVLLIGAAAAPFAERLKTVGYHTYTVVETMAAAVEQSWAIAQSQNIPTVLLSPACASFDHYANFEARGDHFRELCLQLTHPLP
ncbi:MAG: UDP-N-acetylmuramoyl-L-alanine--D-glutamate ligase [Cyanobacteria bacterium P01_G01_bin.54]